MRSGTVNHALHPTKKEEEGLRPLLSSILSDVSNAVLLVDLDRRVLSGNPAAARLFGLAARQLAGIGMDELFEPSSSLRSLCEKAAPRKRPVASVTPLTLMSRDGVERTVCAVVRAINGTHGLEAFLVTLRDQTSEKRLTDALRKTTNEKREAHEWERTRLSRRLHDEVLQDMLALAINVECLPDRCHGNIENCNARALAMQVREMAEHVRHMAHAMRPGILDRMGLVPALRTIVQEANADTLCSIFRLRGKVVQMPWSVETTLYRVALELLTNVRKHSCATQVVTTMAFRKADVTLTVEDNGVGFSRPPDLMTLARQGKYGIVGLYERAENLDAFLDISSKPGDGTRVRIVVPYSSQKVQDIREKAWPGTPETIGPDIT